MHQSFSNFTTAPFNTSTTATPAQRNSSLKKNLLYGLAIPVASLIILVVIICGAYYCYKSNRRKKEFQKQLTPFYAYDQSEAEVVDGVVYGPDSSSVDMMCVVAGHESQPHNGIETPHIASSSNSEESMLITPYSSNRAVKNAMM